MNSQTHKQHAHFAQNLRMPTYHEGNRKELEDKQLLAQKFTNSVNRSIAFWDDPHFSLCLCETMVSIQEYGLVSGPTA